MEHTLWVSWLVGAGYLAAVARLLARTETSIRDFCYAAAWVTIIFCALLLLFARPALAGAGVFVTVVGLILLSSLRFERTGSNLHAYDLVYFLSDLRALGFWIKTDRNMATHVLVRTVAVLVLPTIVGMIEPPALPRWPAALFLLLAIIAFAIAKSFLAPWHYWEKFARPVHFARLLETVFEAVRAARGGGVLDTSGEARLPEIIESRVASQPTSRPTIILILNESTFAPWVYPHGRTEPAFEEFFRSDDGRKHGLRADVFGGPTWATEFSVLTGIPSSCYGPFANHIFQWSRDRINHSLPQHLKKHGYSTGLIYPSEKEFIRSDRFYASLGFDEIRDKRALGAKNDREPDAFYFNHAIGWLKDHDARRTEPLFLYVLTSSNHYPHTRPLIERGGSLILGNTAAPEREWDEYLIRLRRSCRDYEAFRSQLAGSFPAREFLVVHFGDHQPYFTRLPGKGEWRGWPQDCLPQQEAAYRTYFAIHGVHFEPNLSVTLPETIEAAYLSTVLLAAAGIPLDDIFKIRQELMTHHDGKLYFADEPARHGMIAAQLNRLMIERGLIARH
jgi:hypothetical protein